MDKKEKELIKEEIHERTAPAGDIVYQAIYSEGDAELRRGSGALAWSGLAAGLSMGFSLVTAALLRMNLPEEKWHSLIDQLGYSAGFVIVILGRQQLFTENTLTAILPLLKHKTLPMFLNVARLWGVVLATNVIGTFLFAALIAWTPVFEGEIKPVLSAISLEAVQPQFWTMFLRAIFAGWLIALMVWLLPFAEAARVGVIVVVTYLVGLARFPHIIAGSVDALYITLTGAISPARFLGNFFLPTLLGNIIGGIGFVAALAHMQFQAAGREKKIE